MEKKEINKGEQNSTGNGSFSLYTGFIQVIRILISNNLLSCCVCPLLNVFEKKSSSQSLLFFSIGSGYALVVRIPIRIGVTNRQWVIASGIPAEVAYSLDVPLPI